jgi:predicted enzyme related to lactoylglutathione lyase
MIKHIAFTMYPVKDMARARRFYEGLLGLEVGHDFRGEWIEYYPENGCFAISTMAKELEPSSNSGGISFEVDDVDAMVAELKAKGVTVKAGPFSTRVCRMAYVLDPEGNVVGLHKRIAPRG